MRYTWFQPSSPWCVLQKGKADPEEEASWLLLRLSCCHLNSPAGCAGRAGGRRQHGGSTQGAPLSWACTLRCAALPELSPPSGSKRFKVRNVYCMQKRNLPSSPRNLFWQQRWLTATLVTFSRFFIFYFFFLKIYLATEQWLNATKETSGWNTHALELQMLL